MAYPRLHRKFDRRLVPAKNSNVTIEQQGESYKVDYAFAKVSKDVKNQEYLKKIKATYQMGKDRRKDASELKAYKVVDDITLNAHIFYPENHDKKKAKPAHLFFHGGGWAIGLPEWSYDACKGAIKEGRVAIAFDFRLRNVYATDVKTTVSDALSAIAWVRENAKDLGIDPNKVLVDGFSSGAHLALVSAMIEKPEETAQAVVAFFEKYKIGK